MVFGIFLDDTVHTRHIPIMWQYFFFFTLRHVSHPICPERYSYLKHILTSSFEARLLLFTE
jgi:hypothetical protein